MRHAIIALVLSLPLLYSYPAHAASMSAVDFNYTIKQSESDRQLCDKVRYNLELPKISAKGKQFMRECVEILRKDRNPRPPFSWQETLDEANDICIKYATYGGVAEVSDPFQFDLFACIEVERKR